MASCGAGTGWDGALSDSGRSSGCVFSQHGCRTYSRIDCCNRNRCHQWCLNRHCLYPVVNDGTYDRRHYTSSGRSFAPPFQRGAAVPLPHIRVMASNQLLQPAGFVRRPQRAVVRPAQNFDHCVSGFDKFFVLLPGFLDHLPQPLDLREQVGGVIATAMRRRAPVVWRPAAARTDGQITPIRPSASARPSCESFWGQGLSFRASAAAARIASANGRCAAHNSISRGPSTQPMGVTGHACCRAIS